MAITTKDVLGAISRYDKGQRPYRFTKSRAWYLFVEERAYPLKYIYALATDQKPSSFNTSDPIRELRQLGFELKRVPKDYESEFFKRVERARKDPKARNTRLAKAPKMPGISVRAVIVYDRNPDVVAEVLSRANGVCEACNNPAPFLRKSNGEPYLEVHHVKKLADGGEDTVNNAIAVCPNCHRKAHHG